MDLKLRLGLANIFLLFALSYANGQATRNEFVLSGRIVDQSSGVMYLSYMNAEEKQVRDSAKVEKGAFRFSGKITGPTIAYLNWGAASRSIDDPNGTSIFMEPASMQVEVKTNEFPNARVTGSKSHTEYRKYQAQVSVVRDRWKVVMDTLSAINKRSNWEYQETKNWVLKPYNAEMYELQSRFIQQHPSSYVTAYILRFFGRDLHKDSLKKIYDRLPAPVKNSVYGKAVAEYISKRNLGLPGIKAVSFQATDLKGGMLDLDEYRGRYVLLDFWASWCVPCRKGNPHLIGLYEKYKEKGFDIIGIADDDRAEEAWRKAVEKDGIGIWRHVRRGLKYENGVFDRSKDISDKYGIESLPTKILIDPEGVIIARYGEEESSLDEKLREIFGY